MVSHRVKKMGRRGGVAGVLDELRYHEISRQGLGLLLLPLCAWFAAAGAGRISLGLAISLIGQLWRIYAAGVIYKNKRLATTGAYSLVRHPLYLGNFLILGGFALASAHWGVTAVVIGFFLFYYPPAIRYEDAKLENIFGQEWRDWSRDIPAMFPTRMRWRATTDATWSARQSLLRNGELPISIFLLVCAWLLMHRAGMV
jgi:protein-S-isoprenylcysteine O-methyltransferase Ste14